ncbi:hypothetical protein [Luteibacter sp. 22Crub2.1]|uniref:phage terminase large subunit family protein n=1 Tax=Luteibacter sp. 22Crub2.1 TaxID=1283288 RepID=UPI0009CB52B8|nr:hypothetical protein [Luteibacter sp. 22Crub2.1]SKB69434.1 Terminase-like family protein [Luteibacter sp. 22Crub2.1]
MVCDMAGLGAAVDAKGEATRKRGHLYLHHDQHSPPMMGWKPSIMAAPMTPAAIRRPSMARAASSPSSAIGRGGGARAALPPHGGGYLGEAGVGNRPIARRLHGAVEKVDCGRANGECALVGQHAQAGPDFSAQAGKIKALCGHYNVRDIAIDVTGIRQSVFELVRQFFPNVRALHYSPELKGQMVMKAYDVMDKGRLEFDAGWTDLAAAFLAIRKTVTASGRHVTYSAGRSDGVGHADLAGSLMHTLIYEPLAGPLARGRSIVEIS